MRVLSMCMLTAVLALPLPAADEAAVQAEVRNLLGTWKIVKFEAPKGKEPPPGFIDKARMVFRGDKLITTVDGKPVDETTFKIDPGKSPKWIDTKATDGPNKDETAEGIYELERDNLKICIGPPGQKRPTEFKVADSPGVKLGVMTLKRELPRTLKR